MDPYVWTLLLSVLGSGAAALDARPQSEPAAQPDAAHFAPLIEAHRDLRPGLVLAPRPAPAATPAPQPHCAQAAR
ncbi:MAG: hypothetical protein R3357_12660 [Burkholderiales bacterium]|nr:hypothetical protein [Burkholderiales bacterium]